MILQNQVRCNKCGDEPFSAHRHDFKYCKCGSIAVDGGMAYARRVGDIHAYTDMSIEIKDEAGNAAIEEIDKALESGRNSLGILCAAARALRDNGVVLAPARDRHQPRIMVIRNNSTGRFDKGIILSYDPDTQSLSYWVTQSQEEGLDGMGRLGAVVTINAKGYLLYEDRVDG